MFARFFKKTIRTVTNALSVAETESTITKGASVWKSMFRDRANWSRSDLLTQCFNAWRSNPIAKRLVEITTEFVIGDGLVFKSTNKRANKFVKRLTSDPLNDFEAQIPEWCNETWRGGDLFLVGKSDAGGMTYWRGFPAEGIQQIVTKSNDYRQPEFFQTGAIEGEGFPAYQKGMKAGTEFMLHFPLNRPVGSVFGESDLASVVYWIGLYQQWLQDRATLNYFRSLFSWIVKKAFANNTEKEAYIKTAPQPKPGSIMYVDPDEEWETKAPALDAQDAEKDGLSIKRMIAIGFQVPMHYLAESEGSTRTTAEAAGTPTFKRFKSRQKFIVKAIQRVLEVSWEIFAPSGYGDITFEIEYPDITEKDNANLALGVQRIVTAFMPLYNARIVTYEEFIRLVYRFLAETPPEKLPNPDAIIANVPAAPDTAPADPEPKPVEENEE
jgi:hypothetical protein